MQMLFTYLMARLNLAARDESGQTTVEYALVLILICLVIAGLLATPLGDGIVDAGAKIKAKL